MITMHYSMLCNTYSSIGSVATGRDIIFTLRLDREKKPRYVFSFFFFLAQAPATKKLSRLPVVNPATSIMLIKPPAASLSSTETYRPAPIMQQLLRNPFVRPNPSCTTNR